MISRNLSVAKAQLSHLVSSALEGQDVVICKAGVPAVRLVPVGPASSEDPCRVIPELVVSVGDDAMEPLADEDWGSLKGAAEEVATARARRRRRRSR